MMQSTFLRRRKMPLRSLLCFMVATIAFAPVEGFGGPGVFIQSSDDAVDLDKYRWSRRLLLLFAPSETEPSYVQQRAALEAAESDLAERDMVVISDTDPEAQGALRRTFGVEGFAVLLIGKDGGVKLQRQEPITADALFAVIDAMPMRRQEMRD
jgi:hypothetical protein